MLSIASFECNDNDIVYYTLGHDTRYIVICENAHMFKYKLHYYMSIEKKNYENCVKCEIQSL